MGKFLNTEYTNTVNSIVDGFKQKLNNPYYIYNDKSPTVTDYFKQNIEASTLDEALKIYESLTNSSSPIRYNRINDFIIYGIEQIQVQLENGDFGLESSSIEGEGIILPNSIIPIPGDFFKINYLDKDYLFKVIDVTSDTIETGANFFKITYKYDKDEDTSVLDQVVGEYDMIVTNIGSDYRVVIESSEKDYILKLEEILTRLKDYYMHLFYNPRVETFTVTHNGSNIHDPYLIEFMLRNKLLEGGEDFIVMSQQLALPQVFPIKYDSTFLRSVELRDPSKLNKRTHALPEYIQQVTSIFYNRQEDYFSMQHTSEISEATVQIFDQYLLDSIKYEYLTSTESIYNIIVKFFNKEIFTGADLEIFNNIEYDQTLELYYQIPILIFAVEQAIKDILMGVLTIPRVDIGVQPTTVSFNTGVIEQFSDMTFVYFVGAVQSGSGSALYIVNRYDRDNEMKIATTYTQPTSLSDCQVLTYI